jgi:CBS domain-containing protein
MKVKDAMHKGVDWVSPDTPVTELAKLMRERYRRYSDWRE